MPITEQCVVALTWTLKDTLGEVLDQLDEPIEFLIGGHDLLAKIEDALQGHVAGDSVDLHLEPQDAFGDYEDRLLFLEPRERFPADIEEGMGFEGLPEGCNPAAPRDRLYFVCTSKCIRCAKPRSKRSVAAPSARASSAWKSRRRVTSRQHREPCTEVRQRRPVEP